MGRYFRFDGNTFDFATRADVSWRYEYFNEFVFGGERDQRVYGLTKITPSLTAAYDVSGLLFLQYVLGTISANKGSIGVADPGYISTIHANVDGVGAGVNTCKVDTWSFTAEEGSPARAEFTVIGRNTTSLTADAYAADFCVNPIMTSDIGLTIGTNSIGFNRFNLNISNALTPIYKGDTLPQTIRATGLQIDGRIRIQDFKDANILNSSLTVKVGTIGNLVMPIIKLTEIPARVTGFDLPEAEYSFTAYPGCSSPAIRATLTNTLKW